MATTTKRKPQQQSTTAKGLGYRHRQQSEVLFRKHRDGTPCTWCGRPMYKDRTRNWDYNPESTNPNSGKLHAHHGKITRAEAVRRGIPIPLPDELLHGTCNIQYGDGGNAHLAASSTATPNARDDATPTDQLLMAWPW